MALFTVLYEHGNPVSSQEITENKSVLVLDGDQISVIGEATQLALDGVSVSVLAWDHDTLTVMLPPEHKISRNISILGQAVYIWTHEGAWNLHQITVKPHFGQDAVEITGEGMYKDTSVKVIRSEVSPLVRGERTISR